MNTQTRAHFIKSVARFALSCLCAASGAWARGGGRADAESVRMDPGFAPGYLKLHKAGKLKDRGQALWERMASCNLCPRECGADRLKGEKGFCRASSQLVVSAFQPHFGEERPLVGRYDAQASG